MSSTADRDSARQQGQAQDSDTTSDQIGDKPRADGSSEEISRKTDTISFGLVTLKNASTNAYSAAAGAQV